MQFNVRRNCSFSRIENIWTSRRSASVPQLHVASSEFDTAAGRPCHSNAVVECPASSCNGPMTPVTSTFERLGCPVEPVAPRQLDPEDASRILEILATTRVPNAVLRFSPRQVVEEDGVSHHSARSFFTVSVTVKVLL